VSAPQSRVVRRLWAVLVLALALAGLAAAAAPAVESSAKSHDHRVERSQRAVDGGRVMLVGIPGLRWRDVRPIDTPTLWRLLDDAAVGTISVRTVRPASCPADGWLTVNTGARTLMERPGDGARCPDLPRPERTGSGAYVVPGWADVVAKNAQFAYDPAFGLLERQARGRGCTLAVGPGAALALADVSGRVQNYAPSPAEAELAECPLTVVDVGAVRPPYDVDRVTTLAEIDARLASLVERIPPGTRLLVAGLSDSSFTPHLQALLVTGEGFERGWLTARSTRHDGLVQITDLTPTLLAGLGVEAPPTAVGAAMTAVPGRPADPSVTRQNLVDRDSAAQVIRDHAGRFFWALAIGQCVAYPLLAFFYRRQGAHRDRVARTAAGLALVFAAAPAASFLANLIPWWTFAHPAVVLWASVIGISALVGLVALRGPWRPRVFGPAGFVAALTAVVLGLDVILGSTLQLSSLYGLSTLVAGRFYGFGNVAFAVFAMTALLTATWAAATLLRRGRCRAAAVAVAVLGAVAVVVNGWPAFGADFGGVIAMVPGFALLAMGVAGARLTVLRVAGIAAGAVIAVSGIALLDWLRPAADRSHLGTFVQQIMDGTAGAVIERKIDANLSSLTRTPPLAVIVPVLIVVLALVVLRPKQMGIRNLTRAYESEPALRPGLVACLVTAVLGFAVNDSGIIVPAVALAVAVPLAASAWASAAYQKDEPRTPPPESRDSAPARPRRAGAGPGNRAEPAEGSPGQAGKPAP